MRNNAHNLENTKHPSSVEILKEVSYLSVKEVYEKYNNIDGLDDEKVLSNMELYGRNVIPEHKKKLFSKIFLRLLIRLRRFYF